MTSLRDNFAQPPFTTCPHEVENQSKYIFQSSGQKIFRQASSFKSCERGFFQNCKLPLTSYCIFQGSCPPVLFFFMHAWEHKQISNRLFSGTDKGLFFHYTRKCGCQFDIDKLENERHEPFNLKGPWNMWRLIKEKKIRFSGAGFPYFQDRL